MKNWTHTLVSGAAFAATVATPKVSAFAAANPLPTIAALLVWAVAGHLLPSPVPWLWKKIGQ